MVLEDCIICECEDITNVGASSVTLDAVRRHGVEAVLNALCETHRAQHESAYEASTQILGPDKT